MKIRIASVLSILFFTSNLFAIDTRLSDSSIAQTIAGFRSISSSVYNAPIFRTYEKFCVSGTARADRPFSEICSTVRDSEFCKKVEASKRLQCAAQDAVPDVNLWGLLAGCSAGLLASVMDIVKFVAALVTETLEESASLLMKGELTPETRSAVQAAGLYAQLEYAKAYKNSKPPFQGIKAMAALSAQIGKMIYSAVQTFVTDQVDQFGCLNYKARSELVCRVLGDVVIPPAVLFKLIARTAKGARATTAARAVDEAQTLRAAELARIQAASKADIPVGFSPDDVVRLSKAEELVGNGKKLSDTQQTAIIEAHLVGRGQVGKDGSPAKVGNYTMAQLREKDRLLKEAGFDAQQIRTLMENSIVGDVTVVATHWTKNATPSRSSDLRGDLAREQTATRAQAYRQDAERLGNGFSPKPQDLKFSANYYRLEGETWQAAGDVRAARKAYQQASNKWMNVKVESMSEREIFDARRAAANSFDTDNLLRTIRNPDDARSYMEQATRMLNDQQEIPGDFSLYEQKALSNAIIQVGSQFDELGPGYERMLDSANAAYRKIPDAKVGL